MDLKTYISARRGRLASLSRKIGAHASDVSRWASGERPVPIPFGFPIERETNREVTRLDLFPVAVIVKVWPELAQQQEVA